MQGDDRRGLVTASRISACCIGAQYQVNGLYFLTLRAGDFTPVFMHTAYRNRSWQCLRILLASIAMPGTW